MSKLNEVQSSTNNQSTERQGQKTPFLLTHDKFKVKRGKQLKKAQMMICYGAGIIKTVEQSKLSLRRVKVLIKQIRGTRSHMESNHVFI